MIDPSLRVVAFKINQLWREGMSGARLYQVARQAWKMNPHKHDPDYAFAVTRGIVRAVYQIHGWERTPGGR